MAEYARRRAPAPASAPAQAADVARGGRPDRTAWLASLSEALNSRPAVHQLAPASGAVVQMVTEEEIATSLRNVQAYSPDMYKKYGPDEIRATLIAHDITVRGHASSSSGSNQNAQTTQDLQVLTQRLRERAASRRSETTTTTTNNNNNNNSGSSPSSGARESKSDQESRSQSKEAKKAAKKQERRDYFRLTSQGKEPPKKDQSKRKK